eukprot:1159552-Pelagomonas_calceolata.AAC.6
MHSSTNKQNVCKPPPSGHKLMLQGKQQRQLFIVGMDGCNTDYLWTLDMEVRDDVQRNISSWLHPTGRNPFTQQSRPDGIMYYPWKERYYLLSKEKEKKKRKTT